MRTFTGDRVDVAGFWESEIFLKLFLVGVGGRYNG
jgi:hypothetical protein